MVYQCNVQRITRSGHHQGTGKARIISASAKPERPQVSFRVVNVQSVVVLIARCRPSPVASTAQGSPQTYCRSCHDELSSRYPRPSYHVLPTLSANTRTACAELPPANSPVCKSEVDRCTSKSSRACTSRRTYSANQQ